MYKEARNKAKRMNTKMLKAYFKANKIKAKYMLDNLDESDSD